MRRRLLVGPIAVVSIVLASTEARAQSPSPAQPASADPAPPAEKASGADPTAAGPSAAPAAGTVGTPVNADKPTTKDADDELKSVTLTANPLSLILTRIGANVEYLPVRHHAFVLNPYFQHASVEAGSGSAKSETTYTTFGGELGYRFYTGSRGANGFFVGPSVFVQNTNASSTATAGTSTAHGESSTFVYGAILDLGGQHVAKSGFTIGGGVGVMYLVAANAPTATSSTIKFEGVLPRFLFTVGYSF